MDSDRTITETNLSQAAQCLFARITRQEPVRDGTDDAALEELKAWHLVGFDPDRPDVPVPLDPGDAIRRRMAVELDEVQRRAARMTALPDLAEQLSLDFDRAKWRAGGGSEFIDDAATVNARLDDVIGSAREEILAAQPGGPRTPCQLKRSSERDQEALSRGVVLRTVYRDTVRDHPVTSEYAGIMSARGASYRTLIPHFERCIVVDRRVAFIGDHMVEGSPEHAAWMVTDRAMVAWIAAVYDIQWQRAEPWHGELRARRDGSWAGVDTVTGAQGVRTSPRQREILRGIAAGTEQRVLARRMGISTRTLSDQVTELKGLWSVQTIQELTYQWALSPDRMVDDSAPSDLPALPAA